ncbi:MAG: hypothetical protein QM704_08215 [Anaeromyxobacteraceae bacterium]
MRRALAALLVAAPLTGARGAVPDVPVVPPVAEVPGRPAMDEDLPEWIAGGLGFRRAEPKAEASGRARFTAVPFVISNPLIGVGFGVAGAVSFRAGRSADTPFSTLAASVLATTRSQRSVNLRSQLHLPSNDWILVGDFTVNHFPRPAWGLGGDQPDSAETTVDMRELKLHETAYRRIAGPVYAGIGYFLDDDHGMRDERAARGEATPFTAYGYGVSGRTVSSGFVGSLLLDARDNPLDPWRGTYALVRLRIEPEWAGSEQTWESLWAEGRAYLPVAPWASLALWAYGWSAFGRTPYFMLPTSGRDPEMRASRGWIAGRHVGRDLVGAEAELRVAAWQFLSFALGGSMHAASDRDDVRGWPDFNRAWPAASGGLRLTMDRRSLASLAADVAWRPGGFTGYVAFNQAF